jgi:hypothetical protein
MFFLEHQIMDEAQKFSKPDTMNFVNSFVNYDIDVSVTTGCNNVCPFNFDTHTQNSVARIPADITELLCLHGLRNEFQWTSRTCLPLACGSKPVVTHKRGQIQIQCKIKEQDNERHAYTRFDINIHRYVIYLMTRLIRNTDTVVRFTTCHRTSW